METLRTGGFGAVLLWAVVVCLAGMGCTKPRLDPAYEPHRKLMSIVAELAAFQDFDVYRHKPPVDASGRNLYRVILSALDDYEKRYPNKYSLEVEYARARCYERVGYYDKALDCYLGLLTDSLSIGASPSKATRRLLDSAQKAAGTLRKFMEILSQKPAETFDGYVALLKERARRFEALAAELKDTTYEPLALLERERAQEALSVLLLRERHHLPGGGQEALAQIKALVDSNPYSVRRYSHQLLLADAYYEVATDYERTTPAEEFRVERFNNLVETAAKLYLRVTEADGYAEKYIAEGKLRAILAYSRAVREAH